MAKLTVYSGGTMKELPLGESLVIGRQKGSGVYINDARASRNHARIFRTGGRYYVEDLRSRNGTLHNGKLLDAKAALSHGDTIIVCDTKLVYIEKEAAPAPLPPVLRKRPMVTFIADAAEDEAAVNVSIEADANKLAEAASRDVSTLKRSHEHLRTMIQVSEVLATIHDLDDLLGTIMDQLFETFPQAGRGFVMLKNQGTDDPMDLQVAVVKKRGGGGAEEIKMSQTVIRLVATERKVVLCSDALSDDRFLDRMSIIDFKIRSMMCAPIIWRKEEFLGLMHVDTTDQDRAFKQNDLELLTGIAQQAAAAIKNAHLIKAIENETRIRQDLQMHFSPALVEKLIRGDADITSLGGKVKHGTVFFSDIIGFTTMSEILSPPEVVDRLNRYFKIVEEVIFRYGGSIDSFGGDSTLAHWGVLEDQEDAALYAVCAAIEIQNALFKFNRQFPDTRQRPIRLGIGLNTGPLVAGNIGSDQKFQFTVIGDAVNVAQRIESLAGRGQVFVGEQTCKDVARLASVVKLPPMGVKGKAEPLTVFSARSIAAPGSKGAKLLCTIPAEITVHGEGTSSRGVITGAKKSGRGAFELTALSEVPPKGGGFVQVALKPQLKPSLPTFTGKVLASETDPVSSVCECVLGAERVPKDVAALFTPGSAVDCDVGPEEIVRK